MLNSAFLIQVICMIKVAIVDDHKVLTEGLTALIIASGIAAVEGVAHSAAECRRNIAFWKPDVLMLDVGLPDMSGLDFCREIRTTYPDVGVLALTTHNEYSIVRQMLENGASGYLIKNAMAAEVIEGIETVAAGGTFLCHEIDLLMKRTSPENVWLTGREREILQLIVDGYTNPEIAERIFLSPETIKSYRKNLLLKLGAKNTALLVRMALEQKLI